MKQKPHRNNFIISFKENASQKIKKYHRIGMQRMIADAIPPWFKNRICKKVIQIYKHRSEHYQIGFLPIISKKHKGYENWKNKVQ